MSKTIGKKTRSSKPISDFLAFYESYMENQPAFPNRSSTLYQIRKYVANQKTVPFSALTPAWVLGFQEHLRKFVSPNTAYNYLKVLKNILDVAVDVGFLSVNPARDIPKEERIKTVESDLPDFLTPNEISALVKTETRFEREIRYAFLYACFTGANWKETLALTWDKFEIADGDYQIPLEQYPDEPYILPELLQDILKNKAAIGEDRPKNRVFHFENEERITERSIERRVLRKLKEWVHLANIDKNIHFLSASYSFLYWAHHEQHLIPNYYLAILGRKNGHVGDNFIEKIIKPSQTP
jgi:integrase